MSHGRQTSKLVSALLSWFNTNARDLPWRRTRDPYAIWVSEIMLQQTQVKTVIPYWERWLRELPTIESLASASAGKIHKLWEGLGYYTRVRNMQKAAQQIIAERGGQFPQTFDAVLALPGIGRYTAGAICSIAFNQPAPILDGNVIRVLTRIHGIKTDPREKQTNAQLWQLAEQLVVAASTIEFQPRLFPSFANFAASRDIPRCSFLNQSLMELGALICTPRSPDCAACPVQKLCVAQKGNLQAQLPNLGKRAAATERRFLAFVVERNGKFLVRQRPAGIVNAHLWEFPNVEVEAGARRTRHPVRAAASQPNGAQRTAAPYHQDDFHVTAPKPFRVVRHSITRYRITLEAFRAELALNKARGKAMPSGDWRSLAELHDLAFTSAHKKILAALSKSPTPPVSLRKRIRAATQGETTR